MFEARPHHLLLRMALAAMCCVSGPRVFAHELALHRSSPDSAQAMEVSSTGDGVVEDLPLQGGGFQRVMYSAARRETKGIIVMFPGGTGEIDIEKSGRVKNAKNFVVRSDDLWRDRGYGIVLVDALDHQSMRGQRSSAAYAEVTKKIIEFARRQANAPVWVLGTSQGSIAAVNAASHAGRTQLAGLILTESVSILGGSHETVFDAHPDDVRVPSLVVANVDDRCKVAPPSMAQSIARSIRRAPTTVMTVSGGEQRTQDDCGSLTPHGYYGIEEKVVNGIVDWMQQTQNRP
ncbi:Alpha/beta hydrolase family protein [Caballeronia udeis]|uniref:Alpha/beta hydrolase family protein n=1 Tax=Caballeronia udeis TaxID=1232866 RepID=A0A158FIE1_9BURK|nr:alpha/beta hydrolase [Caballeronia udeis]SAL19373.1 Alpha/beta hydrolase family protein [Caballeronia udeis]